MSPRGRRPAGSDTKAQIVDAAREEFAEKGFDAVSMRGVARRAGVDPRLVHHYFEDGKAQLFTATMRIPLSPRAKIDAVVAGPRTQAGANLVRTFLEVWDNPTMQPMLVGLIRSAVTSSVAARMLREFVLSTIFVRVVREFDAQRPEGPPEETPAYLADAHLRGSLAAAQMFGFGILRYVVKDRTVMTATHEALVARLGPVLQAYVAPDTALPRG